MKPVQENVGPPLALGRGNSEISRMENQYLPCGKRKVEVRSLGDYPDEAFCLDLLLPDLVSPDPSLAAVWPDAGGEDTHGRGFARPVRSQQAENLPRFYLQGKSIEGYSVALLA
jgi:hypothetical protein